LSVEKNISAAQMKFVVILLMLWQNLFAKVSLSFLGVVGKSSKRKTKEQNKIRV